MYYLHAGCIGTKQKVNKILRQREKKDNVLCMVINKCEECESGSVRYTALLPNSYPNHANFHYCRPFIFFSAKFRGLQYFHVIVVEKHCIKN